MFLPFMGGCCDGEAVFPVWEKTEKEKIIREKREAIIFFKIRILKRNRFVLQSTFNAPYCQ